MIAVDLTPPEAVLACVPFSTLAAMQSAIAREVEGKDAEDAQYTDAGDRVVLSVRVEGQALAIAGMKG